MDYKLSIHGKNFYKEIALSKDWAKGLSIGTTKACQMRFSRESYDFEFSIHIASKNGQWKAETTAPVCLRKKDEKESCVQYLMPLDRVTVIDEVSKEEMFVMEFSIDFADKTPGFDKMICCKAVREFTLGGVPGCTVRILDPVLAGDYLSFVQEADRWYVNAEHARYGMLVNGCPAHRSKMELHEKDIVTVNGFSFYWSNGYLYTSAETEVETSFDTERSIQQKNHLQYPRFVRSARQRFVIPEQKIDILAPKLRPEEPRKNLVMTLMPMLVSMGMMVMMRASMGGNKLLILMCAVMSGMSVVMGVLNYRNDGIQYKKSLVRRENDYNRYIAEQEAKIQALQDKERIISVQKYPSLQEELQYVKDFDARLFEKQKSHDDYLHIRIGEGTVLSRCEIGYKEQEYRQVEDPLMDYPEKIHEKYRYIPDMPVTLDLSAVNGIGFLGDRTHLYQMTKNLILSFGIEHYYQDVRLYLLMDREDRKYFEWSRWFRNFRGENGLRNFGYDEDSSKVMLENLYAQLCEREKMKEQEIKKLPVNIVFIYRSDLLGAHPVSNYLDMAAKMGFVFLFFEEYAEKLNPCCDKRIFLDSGDYGGYIQDIEDGEQLQHFRYDHIPAAKAAEAAVRMACVYVDEVSLEASLTKNITLYQLLGISNVYDLNLSERWARSRIYDSMAAPLGVKSGDEIVYLDLHEKYHGPHGLVAGTTGSGKSEILQSYILSMATLFHPYEVGFIIIDFKGGGMVNQFRDLPHLNGAITNIDGAEINRSLSSIKAEIKKRQKLFAEYEVNHINDYIRLFKQGTARQPLPHLILIVDEFAELKSEQPEFMKELISTARIGRSLGVHLILATQKPSGVVNDQIWSNSKFKLCLKVQTQGDSNEVLKSPLAAEIREPGRAYLQVGNNEIFQLFQSAYSGAPVPNGAMGETKRFKISKVDFNGQREMIYEQKPKEEKGRETQLDAIVAYVEEYCRLNHIERLPDICLPSLAAFIPYSDKDYENTGTDICVPLGVYDDPDNQYQGIMDVNLSQGHTFIVGSSQMGKTNILQNIIRGIASAYSSSDVQLYLLDFASMVLKNFEGLKHVGDVIVYSEDDKLKNFFKMMEQELAKRKDLLSGMGLSSYSAYRESGQKSLPQIVIMLDNAGAFREMFPSQDEKLLKLAREGSSVGISLIITAQQTAGLGYRYLSNFPKRFALYCNDSGEYSSVLDRCRRGLSSIPGRCLFSMNKTIYEGQIYIAFPAEKEIDRVREIRAFIEQINQKDAGTGAVKTPVMPDKVTAKMLFDMLESQRKEPAEPYTLPLGVNFDNMEVDNINFLKYKIFGVYGENTLGRRDFILYTVQVLTERRQEAPAEIYILDDRERELEELEPHVSYYTDSADDGCQKFREVCQRILKKDSTHPDGGALAYLILNNRTLYEMVGSDETLMKQVRNCLIERQDCRFTFALTNLPETHLQLKATPFVKLLKDANNLFIFRQLQDIRLFDVSTQMRKHFIKPLQSHEMYFKCGDYFAKYKTADIETRS